MICSNDVTASKQEVNTPHRSTYYMNRFMFQMFICFLFRTQNPVSNRYNMTNGG